MEKLTAAPLMMMLVMVMGICSCIRGVVFKVGDSQGWTTINTPNYTHWAASKTFHTGDILVFQYNRNFHNVIQVTTLAAFKSCDASNPFAVYNSGDDTINIRRPGHYFYLCGFPGHCQAGQKVDIRVPKAPWPPSPSPSAGPTSSLSPSPIPAVAPVPSPTESISASSPTLAPKSKDISATFWTLFRTLAPVALVVAFAC
ncbi:hypothetical protein Ancab_021577 [Ancistrocladus abbreviatus]